MFLLKKQEFEREAQKLINKLSIDNEIDVPDFILAAYLAECLDNLDQLKKNHDRWMGGK